MVRNISAVYLVALYMQVAVFIAVGAYLVTRPCFSIYHPAAVYAAFHMLVFVVRPLLAYYMVFDVGLYEMYRLYPTAEVKLTAILVSMLGFVVFTVVSTQVGSSPMHFLASEVHENERRTKRQAFLVVAALFGPIALYSLLRGFQIANGDIEFTMKISRESGHYLNTTSNGYIFDAQMLAAPLSALFVWVFRYRLLSFLPLAAFVTIRAGTGGRGPFVASMVTLALLYAYEKRIKLPNFKVIAVVLAAIFLFRSVGDDRGASVRGLLQSKASQSWVTDRRRDERFLASMDYANVAFLEYIVAAVPAKSQTYDYFLDNLEVFVAPIPRVLWPGKPDAEPFPQIRLFDYGFPIGMTKSLPGEGWFALGWLGVILWCGLAGYLLGKLYEKFAVGRSGILFALGYLCFYPSLVVSFRDGQVISLMRQSVWYILPVLAWAFYARRQRHKSDQAGRAPGGPQMASVPAGNLRPPAGALADLPPAVRRRRLALAQATDPSVS